MGFKLKYITKGLEKAVRQVRHAVTQPFTRSARHKIEDQYQKAMVDCARLEQDTRSKLQTQFEAEREKNTVEKKRLEETLKHNKEQLDLEQAKLTRYLEEKEQIFKRAREEVAANFELLRAALHACKTGQEEEQEFIRLVLKRSPDLRRKFLTLSPLHIAANNNHANLIPLLCQYGADILAKNAQGDTPLEVAEEGGQVEASEALRAALKETLVFWEAVNTANMEAMKASWERGAAINMVFSDGSTILHLAIIRKKPYELIRWLVEAGVDCRDLPVGCISIVTTISKGFEVKETVERKTLSENLETKEAIERKRLAEAREVLNKPIPIPALAIVHPDWRVRDFFRNYFGIKTTNNLEDNSHSKRPSHTIEGGFPETLSWEYISCDHHNPMRLSTFINLGGHKQFFFMDRYVLHLASLDFSKKEWRRHFFHADETHIYSFTEEYRELVKKEQVWLETQAAGQQPIQMQAIKTKKGQEQLILLTRSASQHLIGWRYEPETRRWQAGRVGPKANWKHQVKEVEFCADEHSLFLLGRRENGLECWCYYPDTDEWESLPCNITNICFKENKLECSPQAMMIKTKDGERLFLLLLRKTEPTGSDYKFELYSYNPIDRLWTLHPPTPLLWERAIAQRSAPRMQKIRVNEEEQLFFLEGSMSLWSFSPSTLAWTLHGGGPQWSRVESNGYGKGLFAKFIYIQSVPSHEKGTDIIFFFRQQLLEGIACSVYHPSKKQWIPLLIPGLANLIWDDLTYRIQIRVENLENLPHVVIFNQVPHFTTPIEKAQSLGSLVSRFDKETHQFTQHFTYLLNIAAIEQSLSAAPQVEVFSDLELQRARTFLTRIRQASRSLLASARTGDWPMVFASLKQGADIHVTEQGRNALQLALNHQVDLSTLQRLLQAGIAVQRPSLELARGQNSIEVYNYLARLFDRPALTLLDVETQFRNSYFEHLNKARQFLDKHPGNIKKCQAILSYYRLLSKTNPYAVYAWPGIPLLGETLLLPTGILKSRHRILRQIQTFFVHTRSLHQALIDVGVTHANRLRENSTFVRIDDWTPVIAAIQLKEAVEQAGTETQQEALKIVYRQYQALLLKGTRAAVAGLTQALELEELDLEEMVQWVVAQQLYSPDLFREYYKTRFQSQFKSLASIAREAAELNLIAPAPKLSLAPMLDSLDEDERVARESISQVEQAFLKEKEELQQWLAKRQEEYLHCLRELETQLESRQEMDEKLRAEFQRATLDLNAQFAYFKHELEANKSDALRKKVEKKAFKTLAVMAGACCVASVVGPALASAIGGPAGLGLSQASLAILETVLKGGIMGGINGAFSRKNVGLETLKGAGFAAIRLGIGPITEVGIRAKIEGGHVGKSIIASVGTDIAMDVIPTQYLPESLGFMEEFRESLLKGFVGGVVDALVTRQHFGSSVGVSLITSGVCDLSEKVGHSISKKFSSKKESGVSAPGLKTSIASNTAKGSQLSRNPERADFARPERRRQGLGSGGDDRFGFGRGFMRNRRPQPPDDEPHFGIGLGGARVLGKALYNPSPSTATSHRKRTALWGLFGLGAGVGVASRRSKSNKARAQSEKSQQVTGSDPQSSRFSKKQTQPDLGWVTSGNQRQLRDRSEMSSNPDKVDLRGYARKLEELNKFFKVRRARDTADIADDILHGRLPLMDVEMDMQQAKPWTPLGSTHKQKTVAIRKEVDKRGNKGASSGKSSKPTWKTRGEAQNEKFHFGGKLKYNFSKDDNLIFNDSISKTYGDTNGSIRVGVVPYIANSFNIDAFSTKNPGLQAEAGIMGGDNLLTVQTETGSTQMDIDGPNFNFNAALRLNMGGPNSSRQKEVAVVLESGASMVKLKGKVEIGGFQVGNKMVSCTLKGDVQGFGVGGSIGFAYKEHKKKHSDDSFSVKVGLAAMHGGSLQVDCRITDSVDPEKSAILQDKLR